MIKIEIELNFFLSLSKFSVKMLRNEKIQYQFLSCTIFTEKFQTGKLHTLFSARGGDWSVSTSGKQRCRPPEMGTGQSPPLADKYVIPPAERLG